MVNLQSKVNVCMFSCLYHPFVGGAEEQIRQLSPKLKKKGINVFIVTSMHEGLKKNECIDETPVYRIISPCSIPFKESLKKLFRIKSEVEMPKYAGQSRSMPSAESGIIKLIRLTNELIKHFISFVPFVFFLLRKRIEIVHCHLISPYTILAVTIGKLLGRKTIIKMGGAREIEFLEGYYGHYLYKFLLKNFIDYAVAISEECYNNLIAFGVREEKIIRIPNGVDKDKFSVKGDSYREKIKNELVPWFDGSEKIITVVASIQFRKGIDILVEAFRGAASKIPSLRLLIVGRPSNNYETVKNLVEKYELSKKVYFAGETSDVQQFLSVTDVYVSSARPRAEGLSNSLLEAMSMGLPVVATRVSGSMDVIRDSENGLLVNTEDPDALQDAIVKVFQNEDMAKRMGQEARETILASYSLDRVVEKYENLYKKMFA